MNVEEVMTAMVRSVRPEETVAHAAEVMEEAGIGSLPVVRQDGRLVGIVTDRDIAVRSVAYGKDPLVMRVERIMSLQVACCHADEPIEIAAEAMLLRGTRRLVVLDRQSGEVAGLLSVDDLAGVPAAHAVVSRILQQTRAETNVGPIHAPAAATPLEPEAL